MELNLEIEWEHIILTLIFSLWSNLWSIPSPAKNAHVECWVDFILLWLIFMYFHLILVDSKTISCKISLFPLIYHVIPYLFRLFLQNLHKLIDSCCKLLLINFGSLILMLFCLYLCYFLYLSFTVEFLILGQHFHCLSEKI